MDLSRKITSVLTALTIAGCAGMERGCASSCAQNFASDWIVAQYETAGKPFNCWRLQNTSITNEPSSDGIYWLDRDSGNLVHISGWYNRVQVNKGNWEKAAKAVGVSLEKCVAGKYE